MALTKSQKILSDQIDWEIENIIPVLIGNEWLSNKEISELKSSFFSYALMYGRIESGEIDLDDIRKITAKSVNGVIVEVKP
mgnify:FL=1|tara:strand:+ start:346 stop:588 length:243 start_codon:yes stop_codon:yes gene_type:complete